MRWIAQPESIATPAEGVEYEVLDDARAARIRIASQRRSTDDN
ncbi:MAG: hypothetical protein ACJAZ8_002312 [Planctomycetota bacterium]|jgi:hypothetical protein